MPTRLRELHGVQVPLRPKGPWIGVNLADPALTFWAASTVFYRCTPEGDNPVTPWHDPLPGAVMVAVEALAWERALRSSGPAATSSPHFGGGTVEIAISWPLRGG